MTYGTLELLYKLLVDNNISNVNVGNVSQKTFIFDESLITDNSIFSKNFINNINFTTLETPPNEGLSYDDSYDESYH